MTLNVVIALIFYVSRGSTARFPRGGKNNLFCR